MHKSNTLGYFWPVLTFSCKLIFFYVTYLDRNIFFLIFVNQESRFFSTFSNIILHFSSSHICKGQNFVTWKTGILTRVMLKRESSWKKLLNLLFVRRLYKENHLMETSLYLFLKRCVFHNPIHCNYNYRIYYYSSLFYSIH